MIEMGLGWALGSSPRVTERREVRVKVREKRIKNTPRIPMRPISFRATSQNRCGGTGGI
jgi:hypothetical protein